MGKTAGGTQRVREHLGREWAGDVSGWDPRGLGGPMGLIPRCIQVKSHRQMQPDKGRGTG